MHTSGRPPSTTSTGTAAWNGVQAYCDSKLYVTTLAAAVARHWPDVAQQRRRPRLGPDPHGRPHATDDLALGHDTQVWLATSDEPAATTTGKYWYHRQSARPAAAVNDTGFQDHLLDTLERITGVRLPRAIDGRRTTERTST